MPPAGGRRSAETLGKRIAKCTASSMTACRLQAPDCRTQSVQPRCLDGQICAPRAREDFNVLEHALQFRRHVRLDQTAVEPGEGLRVLAIVALPRRISPMPVVPEYVGGNLRCKHQRALTSTEKLAVSAGDTQPRYKGLFPGG